MEQAEETKGDAVALDIWQDGFAAGLDAAAQTLDPKTKGLSEKPKGAFHEWYSAKKVQGVSVPPTPERCSQSPGGVFRSSDRPTVPPVIQAPFGGDYTVQTLSDQVECLKREVAALEAGYQENLRLALVTNVDHVTRLICDIFEEESKRCFVRMPSAEDLFDKLTMQVRGLALMYETEQERDSYDIEAETSNLPPKRNLMYSVSGKDESLPCASFHVGHFVSLVHAVKAFEGALETVTDEEAVLYSITVSIDEGDDRG